MLETLEDSQVDVRERLVSLVQAYQDYAPGKRDSPHLRPHQVEAMTGVRNQVVNEVSVDALMEGTGIGLFMPVGSGKTVMAADMLKVARKAVPENKPLNGLFLTSRTLLEEQIVGSETEAGLSRFAPELDTERYRDVRNVAQPDTDVMIMNYQSLPGAFRSGFLDYINPPVVVCDEGHHLINGEWAGYVDRLRAGRIVTGMTATPYYDDARIATALFPNVAAYKTLRNGIDEGFLSDVAAYAWEGKTKRQTASAGSPPGKFASDFARSPDPYLVAKIAAMEIAKGKIGFISAAPGGNVAASRMIERVLSQTPVDTPEGRRNIRIRHIDGRISDDELAEVIAQHNAREIDLITNVNMINEGWDSPKTDFAIIARPILSRVLIEQIYGRALRRREGKIATLHELIFPRDKEGSRQLTHADVLTDGEIVQGLMRQTEFQSPHAQEPQGKTPGGHMEPKKSSVDINRIKINNELLGDLAALESVSVEEIQIVSSEETIPYEWYSTLDLASLFGIGVKKAETILADHQIPTRSQQYGRRNVNYTPARAKAALIESLGITQREGDLTLADAVELARLQPQHHTASRRSIKAMLAEVDIMPKLVVGDKGELIETYDEAGTRNLFSSVDQSELAIVKPSSPKYMPNLTDIRPLRIKSRVEYVKPNSFLRREQMPTDRINEVMMWGNRNLITHAEKPASARWEDIQAAQRAIQQVIDSDAHRRIDPVFVRNAKDVSIKPGALMEQVMTAYKLSPPEMAYVCMRAMRTFVDNS